jgi:hypothetical protein
VQNQTITQAVTQKITSDVKDEDGQPKGFPQLTDVSGFEMLYCGSNSRDLRLLKCSQTAKDISHFLEIIQILLSIWLLPETKG